MGDLSEIIYPKGSEYKNGTNYEPFLFFLDAFGESIGFDLLLGYFSSSALNVLSVGFTKFLLNGGKMRMIINNVLSPEDKESLIKGSEQIENEHLVNEVLLLEKIKDLGKSSKHTMECLAWLIAHKRLEIIVIKPKNKTGISHYKSGIFTDGRNSVSFKGSCNFSANALLENLEEFEIKRNWNSNFEQDSIEENKRFFNEIFNKKSTFVDYVKVKDIEERIVTEFGGSDINSLINNEKLLLEKKKEAYSSNKLVQIRIKELSQEIKKIQYKPRFPYSSGPREYQRVAMEKWKANGKKGVFAMATGTGKTITALNCLLEEYNENEKFQAIVLVPTNDLVLQWHEEVKDFNFANIIEIGSGRDWKRKMSMLTTSLTFGGNDSFIIISTYASFHRDSFQGFFRDLPNEVLLIADEAHNIAAPQVKKILPSVHLTKRIGLSATPKRIYDLEGTDEMESFFEDQAPYSYSFTMEEAIKKGVLCQYDYYPHIVHLEEEELEMYVEISKKLMQFFDFDNNCFKNAEIANQLLMKRKRIIHKAHNKLDLFKKIIREEYANRGNLKYTFVYAPEGYEQGCDDYTADDRLIYSYNKAVMDLSSEIRISSFLGETTDKRSLLEDFENGEVDVLTSMKCLDEGVDVPRSELAIFCASTGNPRQFIQRRGRVLRQHKDKKFATIHDMIVVPTNFNHSIDDVNFDMEKSLVIKELERAANFIFMARNQYDAIESVKGVCKYYDIDLFSIHEKLEGNE